MGRKIIISMLNDRQDFQRAQAEDACRAAERLGLEHEVIYAEDNAVTQIQQLFKYLREPEDNRPLAMLVESATNEGLERVARAAVPLGIGWVLTTGRAAYLDQLAKDFPDVLVSSATTNEDEIGRLMTDQYRALLPKGGKILYVEGLKGSAGNVIRRQHAESGLRGSSIEIAKVLTADWTEARAEHAVSFWLRFRISEEFRPSLIAAQNDAIAVGAQKAIVARRPEWADIPLTGCDGLPEGGQQLVDRGLLLATVVKPPTAGQGMELIAQFLGNKPYEPYVLLSPRSYPPLAQLAAKARGLKT